MTTLLECKREKMNIFIYPLADEVIPGILTNNKHSSIRNQAQLSL